MSPLDRAHTTSYSTLIETMRLSCTILSYNKLSKVANFNLPHLHLAPPLVVTPFKFCGGLRQQETRVSGLSCGIACVILCLAILT